jgi:nucleotide-binding universal stress UspA family protein
MTLSRLVHPVEYSDTGMKAAADAATLAHSFEAELHLVYTQSGQLSKDLEPTAHLRLRNFVTRSGGVVASAIETAIVYGNPVSAVAEYASATAADLLVVGRTGPRGSQLWRAGLFAKELASVARRPTLVVSSN